MATRTRITVDTSAVQRRFAAMIRREKDFGSVFRWVMQQLQEAHRENFTTNGSMSGPWKPLDPQYASWKLANYGANGILVRTGDLKDSLTLNSARGAVRDIGAKSAVFGTEIPYASFHDSGTRFMSQRKPVFVPALLAERTGGVVAEYLVHGSIGVEYTAAKKGFMI